MSRRIKILLAATMALVVAGVGIAVAAWLVSGTGSGSAKAGSLTSITVNSATATADLYPGGTGKLFLNVTNPNNIPLKIVSVTAIPDPSFTITSNQPGCGAADLTFTPQSGLNIALAAAPAAGATVAFDLPGAVSMPASAANACQGATFTIPVSVNASTP